MVSLPAAAFKVDCAERCSTLQREMGVLSALPPPCRVVTSALHDPSCKQNARLRCIWRL